MVRLNFVVEGQTEETFVRQVVGPHLAGLDVVCAARCVRTGKQRHKVFKGGVLSFAQCREDVRDWMKQERGEDVRFTTMLDLYALPGDFPGYAEAAALKQTQGPYEQAQLLENSFAEAVGDPRFIPYIQVHEFEALLFADVARLTARFPQSGQQIDELRTVAEQFETPEHIDDGADTAPSKRILQALPRYSKTTDGPEIARAAGIHTLRARCPHFNDWLARLEALGAQENSP